MSEGVRAFAWRITCDNSLVITLAIADKWLLMLSDANDRVNPPWRLGTYMDAEEAQRRAVEMTGSYERLRKGKVAYHTELILDGEQWTGTVDSGAVHPDISAKIIDALTTTELSPRVSPTED